LSKFIDQITWLFSHLEMNLFVVYHYTVAHLHDPSYFTNGGETSSDKHVTEDGVPESKSFIINFWQETPISTLNYKRKRKKLHPFLVVFSFLRFTIILCKIDFGHPTEIKDTCNAYQCIELHDDVIFIF